MKCEPWGEVGGGLPHRDKIPKKCQFQFKPVKCPAKWQTNHLLKLNHLQEYQKSDVLVIKVCQVWPFKFLQILYSVVFLIPLNRMSYFGFGP